MGWERPRASRRRCLRRWSAPRPGGRKRGERVDGASAPTARDGAYTVWTDKEVFVWGGRADSCAGRRAIDLPWGVRTARFLDPTANSWRPVAAAPATLTGREFGSAVWTGKWVIVWGGLTNDSAGNLLYLGDGARYDPSLAVWLPVSTANAPSPRARQGAVWTGTQMIIWGGENYPDYLGDGAAYDPALDAWASISSVGAPRARNYAAATWT